MLHYRDRMRLIVEACYGMTPYTVTEQKIAQSIEIWSDQLYPIIPEARLGDCLKVAFELHKGKDAISAYELKGAWAVIQKRETEKHQAEENKFKSKSCRLEKLGAHYLGQPSILVVDIFDPTKDIEIPCFYCRREEHDKVVDERIRKYNEMYAGRDDLTPFQKFVQEVQRIENWAVMQKERHSHA